jgi:hypothetical protein
MIGQESLNRIGKTLDSAYQDIRNDIGVHLDPKNDILTAREVLSGLLPTLVENKGKLVCTTLENNLTDECINALSNEDPEKRIAFRDEKRENFNAQFNPTYPQLTLRPDARADTALKYGGAAAAGGISATVLVYYGLRGITGAWVLTLLTLALTPLMARQAYRKGMKQAEPDVRNVIKEDVEKYLQESRTKMEEALKAVADQYAELFDRFCKAQRIQTKDHTHGED